MGVFPKERIGAVLLYIALHMQEAIAKACREAATCKGPGHSTLDRKSCPAWRSHIMGTCNPKITCWEAAQSKHELDVETNPFS